MRIAAQRGRQETQFAEEWEIPPEAAPNRGPVFHTQEARPKNAPSSTYQKGHQHPVVDELTLQEMVPTNGTTNGHGSSNGTNAGSSDEVKMKVKEAWSVEETILGKRDITFI